VGNKRGESGKRFYRGHYTEEGGPALGILGGVCWPRWISPARAGKKISLRRRDGLRPHPRGGGTGSHDARAKKSKCGAGARWGWAISAARGLTGAGKVQASTPAQDLEKLVCGTPRSVWEAGGGASSKPTEHK